LFSELAANWESLNPAEVVNVPAEVRARFMGGWREHRQIMGYALLSELPYALRTALRDHPDLDGVDFGVLIVDEYQDLNACDLDVLRRLAAQLLPRVMTISRSIRFAKRTPREFEIFYATIRAPPIIRLQLLADAQEILSTGQIM
jgi:hypothetical protein